MREPRPPLRQTARQKRADAYADVWAKDHRPRAGRPKVAARGKDLVSALELARDSTGDPRFADALQATIFYGFDRELRRTAAREEAKAFGEPDDGYLVQVEFLCRRGKLESGKRRRFTIREACECVVAEFKVPGPSFERTVERLRQRFLVKKLYGRKTVLTK